MPIIGIEPPDIGARVYHDADQSVPNASWTALAFNSERFDTDTIHDTVTNNSRLTCKTAGKYMIVFLGNVAANATGRRISHIRLNGATIINMSTAGLNSTNEVVVNCSCIYSLAVDDYVEARVYQDSGGNLKVPYRAEYTPEFMMQRIG